MGNIAGAHDNATAGELVWDPVDKSDNDAKVNIGWDPVRIN